VIELGGGTGVLTRAVLAHGIAPPDLLVLELNEELHQHLHNEFPGVVAVCGDAMHLREIAERTGFTGAGRADAIVSGLGLLTMPPISQQLILSAAFDCLMPEGRFVQFTYGPANPVNREVLDALELTTRRASFTWWNVPPATVYVYQRRISKALSPKSMR
jgi:phospholipid N-methyltransferase